MNLRINSAFTMGNSEGSVISPGLVPGVDSDPVIFTPTNQLDGMATKSFSGLVFIHTTLVVHEVFINGESGGHSTILIDILLDVFDSMDGIGALGFVLISLIIFRILALFRTCG